MAGTRQYLDTASRSGFDDTQEHEHFVWTQGDSNSTFHSENTAFSTASTSDGIASPAHTISPDKNTEYPTVNEENGKVQTSVLLTSL